MGCITSSNTDKRSNSIETNADDIKQPAMNLRNKKAIKSSFVRVLANNRPKLRVIYEASQKSLL